MSNTSFLVFAALLPAIVLCVYIYKKDRVEKEPIGLLIKLLALGALICFPAAEVEDVVINEINNALAPYVEADYFEPLYWATYSFIGVALIEEGFKLFILYLVTRNNKNFNSLFDGIVYAVFVSLGFAGLENVFYVLNNGFGNAVMRALMSVPGHMFFAVFMGYYYSLWHMHTVAAKHERNLRKEGLINSDTPEFSGKNFMWMCIIVPTFVHGFYDYCCFRGTYLSVILLYAFVVFMYVFCFKRIKHMSKKDVSDNTYASTMLYEKYPQLRELINHAEPEVEEMSQQADL